LWGTGGVQPGELPNEALVEGRGTAARDGESPVDESALDSLTGEPEYHGTRATLWEAGGTTLQG